jgi:hypothetical protein
MHRLLNIVACLLVGIAILGVGRAMFMSAKPKPDEETIPPPQTVRAPQDKPPVVTVAAPRQQAAETVQPEAKQLPAPAESTDWRRPDWKWESLENDLARIRAERKDRTTAVFDLHDAYDKVANPKFTKSSDYPEHCSRLATWRQELPNSPLPLIVLAKAHIEWGWQARGIGLAFTVTKEGWELFHTRIAEARRLLEQAIKMGVPDGEAHSALLLVNRAESVPLEESRKVLDAGRAIDPTYHMLYIRVAESLLPRWQGQPGDIEQFAAEVVKMMPGDDGLDTYGQIAFTIHDQNQWQENTLFRGRYDPRLLVQAADVMVKRYPDYPNVPHFAALCALAAQDHAAACRIRPLVAKYYENPKIWVSKNSHLAFLKWCDAAPSLGGEETSIWAGPLQNGDVFFDADPRYVWCMNQFGSVAASRLDMLSKEVSLALPSQKNVVNNLAVDAAKGWVLVSSWDRGFQGWELWDAGAPEKLFTLKTEDEQCRAIAIHPKAPEIAWADGKMVKSLSVDSGKRGKEIMLDDYVHGIRYSQDGTLLSINTNKHLICDVATGTIKFALPQPSDKPRPLINVNRVLAIDEQGRVLASAIGTADKPPKYPIVRFAPDGGSYETLFEDLRGVAAVSDDIRWLAVNRLTDAKPPQNVFEIWDLQERKKAKELGGDWAGMSGCSFSRDNKKLVTSGPWSNFVKVWSLGDIATGASGREPGSQ